MRNNRRISERLQQKKLTRQSGPEYIERDQEQLSFDRFKEDRKDQSVDVDKSADSGSVVEIKKQSMTLK